MKPELGPNHPHYGKPLDVLPPRKPVSEHRPRSCRPPRPLPPVVQARMRGLRNGGVR